MEKLYLNLSEEEFTKGRKILLWIFVVAFFLGGVYVAMLKPVFGKHSIKPVLSAAPFGISFIVGIIATYATIKRKDQYFLFDGDKVEFRYGIIKPARYSFLWNDVRELVMPHKEKKARIIYKNGSAFLINLSWLQGKKASLIRKHLFQAAREKNINVLKVIRLSGNK